MNEKRIKDRILKNIFEGEAEEEPIKKLGRSQRNEVNQ